MFDFWPLGAAAFTPLLFRQEIAAQGWVQRGCCRLNQDTAGQVSKHMFDIQPVTDGQQLLPPNYTLIAVQWQHTNWCCGHDVTTP